MRVLWFALLAGCGSVAPEALPVVDRPSTLREISSASCGLLGWPVEAEVSSGFGTRDGRPHLGVDLVVPEGVPVLAACDGVVRYAGDTQRGYGRMVLVEHEGGLVTAYAHNESLLVAVGQVVTRGQTLALSGQSGHVTAPHVHFEVRIDGHAVDPVPRLESKGRGLSVTTR